MLLVVAAVNVGEPDDMNIRPSGGLQRVIADNRKSTDASERTDTQQAEFDELNSGGS